jgi:hypothetical protein
MLPAYQFPGPGDLPVITHAADIPAERSQFGGRQPGRSTPRARWPTEGIVGQEFHDEVTGADGTIAIFTLDGGLLLTLYERTNLAKDTSLPAGSAQDWS